MSSQNIYNLIVPDEDSGQRLDVYLKKHLSQFSREHLKRQILSSGAKINDELIKDPNFRVQTGQKVEIKIEPAHQPLIAQAIPLDIVYESDDFLVINKPAGLAVHPGAALKQNTFANALIHHFPKLARVGEPDRPGIVHRLDRDTSGLILIARNQKSLEYARNLFKSRQILKQYQALLVGHLTPGQGLIEKPLGKDFARRRVKIDAQFGKPARTEYTVINHYVASGAAKMPHLVIKDPRLKPVDTYSYVRVLLHTGRTHQIRVHFASTGHPVVGDKLYGTKSPAGLTRQFLHAGRLAFQLPSGSKLEVKSELPEDLQDFLNKLKIVN